jgi:hypothetical protein
LGGPGQSCVPARLAHQVAAPVIGVLARPWTASATLGIMPRHACSARCGARRRSGTWRFRSAPCLLIGRLSPRQSASDARRTARARLWICGQRKSVAHISTGATINNKHQFDSSEDLGSDPARHIQATVSPGSDGASTLSRIIFLRIGTAIHSRRTGDGSSSLNTFQSAQTSRGRSRHLACISCSHALAIDLIWSHAASNIFIPATAAYWDQQTRESCRALWATSGESQGTTH